MLFDILHQELVETYIKDGTLYQTFIAYNYNGNAYITLYYILVVKKINKQWVNFTHRLEIVGKNQ